MTEVLEKLTKAGIDVVPYVRGPAGPETFMLSVDAHPAGVGRLRIWEGTRAQIEAHGDKRHRQAVLTVVEPARKIRRNIRGVYAVGSQHDARRVFEVGSRFPVQMPPNTKFAVIGDVARNDPMSLPQPHYWDATVEARSPRSTQSFLVGIDETHHFVAALPKRASSVPEAHAVLRPRAVPARAARQGEWFFVQASPRTLVELEKLVPHVRARFLDRSDYPAPPFPSVETTHWAAQTLVYRNALYACGYVLETRGTRHEPLFLPEWSRVFRNRELLSVPTLETVRRSWD